MKAPDDFGDVTPAPLRLGCPKCGREKLDTSPACPRCGLVFSLWKGPAAEPTDKKLDVRGDELWRAVCEVWQDEQRHDAFVKYCSQSNLLGIAGRLYRNRIDVAPRDPMSLKMQARIVGMVTAILHPLQAQRPAPVTRHKWFWIVMGLGLAGGAAAGAVASFAGR
jgi:hypothetical protein